MITYQCGCLFCGAIVPVEYKDDEEYDGYDVACDPCRTKQSREVVTAQRQNFHNVCQDGDHNAEKDDES